MRRATTWFVLNLCLPRFFRPILTCQVSLTCTENEDNKLFLEITEIRVKGYIYIYIKKNFQTKRDGHSLAVSPVV